MQNTMPLKRRSAVRGIATSALVAILAGVAAAAAGGWWVARLYEELVVQDARRLQWKELMASEAVLRAAPVPSGWLGGAFLSGKAIEEILKSQAGTTLEVKNVKDFEDLRIEVRKISLATQVGAPAITIEAVASSDKRKLALGFVAKGLLGYVGSRNSDETSPKQMASFAVHLTSVKAKFSWSDLSLSTPGVMKELVAAGVMKAVGERMVFEAPMTHTQILSLGDPPADDRKDVKVRKVVIPIKETGGSITMEVSHRQADLKVEVTLATPLFSPHGLWLLATDKPFTLPQAQAPEKVTSEDLEGFRSAVAKLHAEQPATNGDAGLFLNRRLMVDLVGQMSKLPDEQRTIYAKSVDTTGRIYDMKWKDNVAGKGGIYVEGKGKDFAEVSALIAPPSTSWAPAAGVTVKTSATVNAKAKLHWHFDPLVGGGVGNDVSIGGSGSVPVEGSVRVELAKVGDEPVALLVPTMTCANAPVEMMASGDIKLGVKTGVRLFDRPMAPTALVDSSPRKINFDKPNKDDAPEQARITPTVMAGNGGQEQSKVRVVTKWKHKAVNLVTTPSKAEATKDGFLVVASLASITPASDKDAKEQAERKAARKKALKDYAEAMPKPSCPEAVDLRVMVAGMEIGPNGEGIKIIGELADLHNRVFNEAKKILTNPVQAAKDAPKNIEREVRKAWKRVFG